MGDDQLTIPKLLRQSVVKWKDRTARKFKKDGGWREQTWGSWGEEIEGLARGLCATGLEPGQRFAILSHTRQEWPTMDLAVLSTGAVTVPIYPSSLSDQVQYILEHSESRGVFCENGDQLQKVLEVRGNLPGLKLAVLLDGEVPDGLPTCEGGEPFAVTVRDLVERGASIEAGEIETRVGGTCPETIATIVYTSGTTGPPKGVMQTHANHIGAVTNLAKVGLFSTDDMNLLFLPLAHSLARLEEFAQLWIGQVTAYAESIDKLIQNIKDLAPTMMVSVPRIYEKVYAAVQSKAAKSPIGKRLFPWFVKVGREVSRRKQQKRRVPFLLGLKYKIADKLLFQNIRAAFGGRIRFCVSGGAPLAREIGEFMHAAGILILEGYGLTETCPILTVNRPDDYKFGTVGRAIPEVELKLAPDGEILGRGPNISIGYYKREEATKEVYLADGWFATGDIGELDDDGFLRITDRKKDLIKTSGGKYVAPQEVENHLKGNAFVAQCMVVGDRRKFCSVIIVPNRERLEAWAKEQGIAQTPYEDLVQNPKTKAMYEARLKELNRDLASYEQPKKLLLAAKEWTPEGGELTPTMKVKRKVVAERFAAELDALYSERQYA